MKKKLMKTFGMVLGIALAFTNVTINSASVYATEIIATVQGTIAKGTTNNILYLTNDSEGTYQIKIDSETDLSGCKVLTVGKTVKVAISRGDDNYLHAVRVEGTSANKMVNVDTENSTTVSGTVQENSTEEMVVLKISDGDMFIKIDPTTDLSGCRVVVAGMKVNARVARGSDAVMHAISISDSYSTDTVSTTYTYTGSDTTTTVSTTTEATAPEGTVAVSGTVADGSTDSMLNLNTDSGIMKIAIDESTDTTGGFVFTTGNKLTAYVYRGSDAVMHASKTVGKKAETVERGAASTTFTGTISSSSTESELVVITSGGTMKFKVDATTTLSGSKALVKGKAIVVSATTGGDKYWHATTLSVK